MKLTEELTDRWSNLGKPGRPIKEPPQDYVLSPKNWARLDRSRLVSNGLECGYVWVRRL